jgi:oligopeptide transport system substrate-binding protein
MSPPIPATFYVGFNTSKPPFDDHRVRQAFASAIDREALVGMLGMQNLLPATSLAAPGVWPDELYLFGEVGLPYDPAKTSALLDEAGWPTEITLATPRLTATVAEYVAGMWRAHAGVVVHSEPMEWEDFMERLEADPPDAYLMGWVPEYRSPYSFLDVFSSDSPDNFAHYQNTEYDGLLADAVQETDEEAQLAMYVEAERILCEVDAVIAPLYHYLKK